jgi:transcriptional regulator with XRE-family HTH domain
MDVSFVIRQRLDELGLEQKELARAARVTESYISQLLTRRKVPPAPSRTDIYGKMERRLELPKGTLAALAEVQRKDELKKQLGDESAPLFGEVRELILRKCNPGNEVHVRAIFEKQPFGELERLVTQKLLDVVKRVANEQLEDEAWLRELARASRLNYEEMRVRVLEFLDEDIFNVSLESSLSFLDPVIESWDIDLATFALEIVLNRRIISEPVRRFEFMEQKLGRAPVEEPGFREFLEEPSLSGTATEEELAYLSGLTFSGRRPRALYYYRELQSLRDPLHFYWPASGER